MAISKKKLPMAYDAYSAWQNLSPVNADYLANSGTVLCGPSAQGTDPPMGTRDGHDPRSPANSGMGWGWTPNPRRIGGGDGDVPSSCT
jgi:hypothetical protein